MTEVDLVSLALVGGLLFVLFLIFAKPVLQRINIGGQYRPPEDSGAAAWRFLTYLVLLTSSVLFFLIAELPSAMSGWEIVFITFGVIVLWEVRVDLISGTTAPLCNAAHFMKHPWDRDVDPLLYWLTIAFNVLVGLSIVWLGAKFLWLFLQNLTSP